jgi:hypothetical protein
MATSARKPVPADIEHCVLDRSRRRCALCVHFHGDWSVKDGQLAHLDRNPANFDEDNLAFLCLPHHDDYDTTRRQTKNLTIREAKTARDRLYGYIDGGGELGIAAAEPGGRNADRRTLADFLTLMRGPGTLFLKYPNFAGTTFTETQLNGLITIVQQRNEPEHEFLDSELETLRGQFLKSAAMFLSILTMSWERVPDSTDAYRVSLHTRTVYPSQYQQMVDVLQKQATEVYTAYQLLIRNARQKLEK